LPHTAGVPLSSPLPVTTPPPAANPPSPLPSPLPSPGGSSPEFRQIGIVARPDDPAAGALLRELAASCSAQGRHVLLDASACPYLPAGQYPCLPRHRLVRESDVLIVIGGDGTLLGLAREAVLGTAPILGVNLGRLGFLVDISPDEMVERLRHVFCGAYLSEARMLLAADVFRHGQAAFSGVALNDVVLRAGQAARMIEFETFIDGRYLLTQRGDGMVLASPTGSTAYALSTGGPIVDAGLDAIVLAPICPHALTHRPLVVRAQSVLELRLSTHNRTPALVSLDGQRDFEIENNDVLRVRRHSRPIRLLHPTDYDPFHILRAKLRWGEQP